MTLEMPLQFDVYVAAAEQADETIEEAADAIPLCLQRRPAGEGDEAAGRAFQFVERQRAFAFRRAHLHARDQATEIAISLLRFAEDSERNGRDGLEGRDRRDGRTRLCPSRLSCPSRPSCPS